ncbi:hypothetical protein OEZ78_28645, partial [Leclercia adecarboxylata]|uniref:hypothetical protein n=1 Tax=Leclercia adecarboxylata TaxID=83655 RepID=UPI00234CC51D
MGVILLTFQYADQPRPRAGMSAIAVDLFGQCQLGAPFAILADLEQQLGTTLFQPRVVGTQRGDLRQHRIQC